MLPNKNAAAPQNSGEFVGVHWLCHVSSHALVQTVIQSYSPPEFRGRAIAIFHMNQVLLLLGGMLIGALSSAIGAPWAAAAMSIAGTLCMVALFIFDPKARTIR